MNLLANCIFVFNKSSEVKHDFRFNWGYSPQDFIDTHTVSNATDNNGKGTRVTLMQWVHALMGIALYNIEICSCQLMRGHKFGAPDDTRNCSTNTLLNLPY